MMNQREKIQLVVEKRVILRRMHPSRRRIQRRRQLPRARERKVVLARTRCLIFFRSWTMEVLLLHLRIQSRVEVN